MTESNNLNRIQTPDAAGSKVLQPNGAAERERPEHTEQSPCEQKKEWPIAVFDSGVGGVSVLRELHRVLPAEHLIYFGDSAHAPYGTKTQEALITRCREITDHLIAEGAKCLVVACNTATSAAVPALRKTYPDLPIIGMEPAVKPAAQSGRHPTVLVMATPFTIRGERLHELIGHFEDEANILLLPAPGIVTYVENGETDAAPTEGIRAYLKEILSPYFAPPVQGEHANHTVAHPHPFSLASGDDVPNRFAADSSDESGANDEPCRQGGKIDAIVLGCTHFPFVERLIRETVPYPVQIFDGAHGTAMQTKRRLAEKGLLREGSEGGSVRFENSDPGKLKLERSLFA